MSTTATSNVSPLPTTEPRLRRMPPTRMAVVHTRGDPNVVGKDVFPALYGAVYTLKFDHKKKGKDDVPVAAPRARWPDADKRVPKERWRGIWGLPVPARTRSVPQKLPAVPVAVESWTYGMVAEILHKGSYASETGSIERLRAFIQASGYEIVGPHEEEYLSRPNVKEPKTVIRYEVRKKRGR